MLNIQSVFIFLFVFSILYVVNVIFKLIRALMKPEKFILSGPELLFFGISLSYIITYITQTT
jgi:hypothetical protein